MISGFKQAKTGTNIGQVVGMFDSLQKTTESNQTDIHT